MKSLRTPSLNYFARVPFYFSARALGLPPPLPLSLALCVTHRCNAGCLTCNIASRQVEEMTLGEWTEVFRGIGRSVPWFTITGGEPFLRDDMPALLEALLEICAPVYVTAPTNGSLPGAALEAVKICRSHPETGVAINISIDGPREVHDRVRGRAGSFDSAVETFHRLSNNKPRNLRLGIHTVISKYNVDSISELVVKVNALKPDSHFFEIAQTRAELAMECEDIAPDAEGLRRALSQARRQLAIENSGGGAAWSVVRDLREEYYKAVEAAHCDGGRMPECYAGVASAYVAPDGTLAACPNRGEKMGMLGSGKAGFKKIWRSAAAVRARREVRREDCRCPLANASYTNLIFGPKNLARIVLTRQSRNQKKGNILAI